MSGVVAGYACLVRKSGVPTAAVTELLALTSVAANSTQFRIVNSAKRVLDPTVDFNFHDGTTTVAYSSISALDFVNGVVTFSAPLGSPNSCSFNGNFLPITTSSDTILDTKSFKLTQSQDLLDRTVFTGTSSDFTRKRIGALKDLSISIESLASIADLATLGGTGASGTTSQYENGAPMVVELFFGDSASVPRFRGFCMIASVDRNGEVAGLVNTSITWKAASVTNQTANQSATFNFGIQP